MGILLEQLRKLINDERYIHKAIRILCTDTDATACTVEITSSGYLETVVTGGSVSPLSFNLSDSAYNTLSKLTYEINEELGYSAELDIDASADHLSTDLEKTLPTDCLTEAYDLVTRLFTDDELTEILEDAVNRHNAAYTLSTVPDTERYHVLRLARIEVLRVQAHDSIKRRGLDMEVNDLRELANDLERSYLRDLKRERDYGGGSLGDTSGDDITVGRVSRLSLRTNEMVPGAHNKPPTIPVLDTLRDAGSGQVYVTWERNHDLDFESFQLYRDTDPNVSRDLSTSSRVLLSEDQRKVDYTDTVPASGTYFYKLYIKDTRGEYSASLISFVMVTV